MLFIGNRLAPGHFAQTTSWEGGCCYPPNTFRQWVARDTIIILDKNKFRGQSDQLCVRLDVDRHRLLACAFISAAVPCVFQGNPCLHFRVFVVLVMGCWTILEAHLSLMSNGDLTIPPMTVSGASGITRQACSSQILSICQTQPK